jgi:hypothetical protein
VVAQRTQLRPPAGGQLQFVQAEHRQRQRHEQCREQHQHPGGLERDLQVGASQAGNHPGDGEHHRAGEHVHQRQPERAQGTDALATPGDQSRKNRDHRQHAGSERKEQPGAEESEQGEPAIGSGQLACEALILGLRLGHALRRSDAFRRSDVSRELLISRRRDFCIDVVGRLGGRARD